MGALSDLVSVLIDLDVGAFCLQFLYAFEPSLISDQKLSSQIWFLRTVLLNRLNSTPFELNRI